MSYYIKDTTIGEVVQKNTLQEFVLYLEQVCVRYNKKSRAVFMDDMISIGHGYDDLEGAYFTELMSLTFDIGVCRKDGKLVRTNIHEHSRNIKYRTQMGD
jgi:hypothetical protein